MGSREMDSDFESVSPAMRSLRMPKIQIPLSR